MSSKGRSLKVGVFVIVAIVLATVTVFLIGDNRRVWDRKVTYHAAWDDVVGLKPGSAVRMAGIDVGSVTDVKPADDPKDAKIYVTIKVARKESVRVRKDSTITIVGKGLLGDKMVELSIGSPTEDPIPENGTITSRAPSDLGQMMTEAQDIAHQAKLTMQNVQRLSEQMADPEMTENLRKSVRSLHEILDGVAHKNGVAHRLIYDEEEGRRVASMLANLDNASANVNQISANAREISEHAKSGPGLVHTLVYDDKLASGTTDAMVELSRSLTALRTGNGIGHAIVYGDDSSQHIMGNVSAMSDDLRDIMSNVKAGRGTIGGLLVDPSIYEDIKSMVGNVERNDVLRAIVRYSIKQNEDKSSAPRVQVKDSTP